MATHNKKAGDPTQRLLVDSRSPNTSLVPAIATTTSFTSNLSAAAIRDSGASSMAKLPHPEYSKSVDLETHGDEIITLVQAKTTWGKCWDISRLTFGSLLLVLSSFSIVYAITEHSTLMPTTFPNFTLYIILFIGLFCIGVLEGLQIAVVELAHEDPHLIKSFYPRASKLLKWENTGRNVERFLIGRQVLLVGLVFVIARVTTFDVFIVEMPDWFITAFMFSGFLGVILVVTVAQLTPQVLAAAYPIEFLNLPGMNIAFGICLFVESTGLAHAVWILCVAVKTTVYSCVCKYHALNTKSMMTLKMKKKQSLSVNDIEMGNDASLNKNGTGEGGKVVMEIQRLRQQFDDVSDLFDDNNDDEFHGASYYINKFKQAGLSIPCFLLPPDDENHIPPHEIAIALLRNKNNRT